MKIVKMKNNIKLKIYKIICYMLIILAIAVISIIAYKYGSNKKNERESQATVEAFYGIDFSRNEEELGSQIQLEYKGYKVNPQSPFWKEVHTYERNQGYQPRQERLGQD